MISYNNLMKNSSTFVSLVIKLTLVTFLVIAASSIYRALQPKPAFQVNLSQAAVVKEIRDLNRLETSTFTIEKIIDAKTTGNIFQEVLYGDKILLIAHGQVIAGVDLSKLKNEDVTVEGTKLTMKLPAPEILVSRLDNEKTRVYDRQQGLLSKGQKDIESEARKQAELSIKVAACEAGILKTASDSAVKQLTTLFSTLGFTEIQIDIAEGKCQ